MSIDIYTYLSVFKYVYPYISIYLFTYTCVAVEIEPPAVDDGGNVQLRFDVKHLAVPAQALPPAR
jgi:hypothetical protein